MHSIDVEYWALPRKMRRGSEGFNIDFDEMKKFDTSPEWRQKWVMEIKEDLIPQLDIPEGENQSIDKEHNLKAGFNPLTTEIPSDDLLCLDNSFFLGSHVPPEAFPDSPAKLVKPRSYEGYGWIEAGQHIHFTPELESLADLYLMELFRVSSPKKIPPIITVHIRRGDFLYARGLTTLDSFKDSVERVRMRLQARIDEPDSWRGAGKGKEKYFKGVSAKDYKVVVTTDEKPGSDFVLEMIEFGWKVVDHDAMKTEENFDLWYPSMIDSAILARGRGFVGTEWSTFSYLAGSRVK